MQMRIKETKVSFYENDNEIMYMDYPTDECVWFFNSDDVIIITRDMELFDKLDVIMKQQYVFDNNSCLRNIKTDNKLVWHSDCYYNPDDEWSIKSVCYLIIEQESDCYKIRCKKPLDDVINIQNKTYCICFSAGGNGQYSKNINTGFTLQDDFVLYVYQELIKNKMVKKLYK